MARFVLLLTLAWALLVGTASVAGAQADGGTVYRQFQEAINRGDADGATALLTDDARWLRPPACRPEPCVGKARLRQEIVRQIGDHNQATAFSAQPRGGAVVVRYELRSDATRSRGFERRIILDTVTLRGGRIRGIVYGVDASDPQTAAFEAAAPRPAAAPAQLPRTGAPVDLVLVGAGLMAAVGLVLRRGTGAGRRAAPCRPRPGLPSGGPLGPRRVGLADERPAGAVDIGAGPVLQHDRQGGPRVPSVGGRAPPADLLSGPAAYRLD